MADFYIKYGSKKAKLVCNYKSGKTSIKLHDVGPRYVVTKNRKIIAEYVVLQDALKHISNLIEYENSDFINF